MSFESRFDMRWRDVIVPAVASIEMNNVRLEAHRVDARKVADSILTEIVQGISQYRLVLVDITAVGQLNDRAVRNGNVMYELGIAHATRLPEEVLLFRSDSDPLLFDVAGIRVNHYAPDDNVAAAKHQVSAAIVDALWEVDLRRSLAVQQAVEALGGDGLTVLFEAVQGMKHPATRTMGDLLGNAARRSTVGRLLDVGVLATAFDRFAPGKSEMLDQPVNTWVAYHLTAFGKAVFEAVALRMGLNESVLDECAHAPPAEKE